MKVTETHKELDTILTLLNSESTVYFSLIEIAKYLYPDKYRFFVDENKGKDIFNVQIVDSDDATKVYQSIMILSNKKLVYYDENSQSAMITLKGIIQNEGESFQEEIERKNLNLKLQRWSWRILPWAAVITTLMAILTFALKLCDSIHLYTNHK